MHRLRVLAPFLVLAAVGCGDTPTAVTDSQTVAQQEAAQKQADDAERNMTNGAYDPSAPKNPSKPKK